MNDLKNKAVLLTGASTGIGAAVARALGNAGARVAVHYRGSRNEAEAVARDVEAAGGQAIVVQADVTDSAAVDRMVNAVHEAFGRIDVLINNAAIFHGLDRQDQSLAYFNRIMSVNFTGVWLMTRAVERFMKRQRGGKIVNQSSTAAYITNVGMVDTSDPDRASPPFHYSLAKLGVSGMTKFFAGSLGPWE